MDVRRRQPIGIELVRRGIVTEADIEKALEYQKSHPGKKIGDILNILDLCDPNLLLDAMGEILGERTILLTRDQVNLNLTDYISLDVAKQNKAVPFDIANGKVKVCFADTSNKKSIDIIRLILLNKGLVMDRYITFETNVHQILEALEGRATDHIKTTDDITGLIDTIIKTGIKKRASDIHIEPLEKEVRIRYRIDGELFNAASIAKDKQSQIIGRLKAISNMHQEKQEAQDGRILLYPEYNIRVSSQKNVNGEKFVLRLLRKSADVRQIFDLGFPKDEDLVRNSFNKKNSITIVAAPTGEGKTTTLYSIVDYLNRPEINITTIEDPVEIRIGGLNQIEIDPKATFSDSLRTVLRQDPDVILVGEIRDKETAEIAMRAGQTGHYVLSTIHTIDSIEVITRLRKMGISNYDIASTLATSVSQRLVRKLCPECMREREYTAKEKEVITAIGNRYGVSFDLDGKKAKQAVGCSHCNHTGYYNRIGIFEVLIINDAIRELITQDSSSLEIRKEALKNGYQPLILDGIRKVLDGVTTLDELDKKLIIY